VTIEVRGQEATLSFASASGTSRAVLEDALPRLREMLAGAGLQLANAHVGDQPRRDFGRGQRPGTAQPINGGPEGIQLSVQPGTRPRGSHLIDVIA
jgi:flagellar hook-length control protein FliK